MEKPAGKIYENANPELKNKSIRGSFALLTAQGLKFLLQIIVTIFLSRLILPEDFGVFAVVFAVANFIAIFKDGGLTLSTVQTQILSECQVNTLFWLNGLLGSLLTVFTVLAAWFTALIYLDVQFFKLGSVLAPIFFFIGLASQPRALLRRELDFVKLAEIEISAMFLGNISAVVAAWYGAGIWALVILNLVQEFMGMILVFLRSNWRPSLRFDWKQSLPLVTFGGYLTAFELIGYLNFNLDKLLIGWFCGSALLGFYDKAFQLLLVPLNNLTLPLGKVVHSTLSRLQDEPERFRQYFYRYVLFFAGIGMPLVALIFGTADLLIPFLLGENWAPSVDLFRALAPAAFCMTVSPAVSWLYISLGRAKRQLLWHSGLIIIWLFVLVAALQNSVLTAAIAFSVMRVASLVPTLIYVAYNSPVSWVDVLKNVALPAFAALTSLAVMLLGRALVVNNGDRFWQIIFNALVFLAGYVLVWILVPRGRKLIKESFRHFRATFGEGYCIK
jgi:O-antigen/teichoic acid export membrane protein